MKEDAMNNFQSLLEHYSKSHRHAINKILHFIGVPFVVFATLLFFSWIHLSMPGLFDLHTSWLFSIVMILYYFQLDKQLALLLGAILLPFIFLANLISGYWLSFPIFCIFFAVGWILQLVGHFLEGEQPAVIGKPYVLLILPLLTLNELVAPRCPDVT
jgi:uncharacterized membrane protein YGL010W